MIMGEQSSPRFILFLMVILLALGGCRNHPLNQVHRAGGDYVYQGGFFPERYDVYFDDPANEVDDATLAQLAPAIRKLNPQRLILEDQALTDASVKTILTFRTVNNLRILGSRMSANGIRACSELPHLRVMGVGNPPFANTEIESLRKEFPKIEITCWVRIGGSWINEDRY